MTNNKKAKERECLKPFLLYYNQINNSNYKEIATPDEDPKNPLNVDFLCKDQLSGKVIAVEILGFHHSEWTARGDVLVDRIWVDIGEDLKGRVKGKYDGYIPYTVLNCETGTCKKVKKKIVAAILNESKSMKSAEKIVIKPYEIRLDKISDDGDSIRLILYEDFSIGPGSGASELSKNIKEKNLKQFKSAKEEEYETFLLIDDQRELLAADDPPVLKNLRKEIDLICKDICYINHIFLRSRQNKFYTLK